jgi:hypothetical protein
MPVINDERDAANDKAYAYEAVMKPCSANPGAAKNWVVTDQLHLLLNPALVPPILCTLRSARS